MSEDKRILNDKEEPQKALDLTDTVQIIYMRASPMPYANLLPVMNYPHVVN